LNGVQIQENALVLYEMPIETSVFLQAEVTPRAFSEMPNTEIRTEFLLIKQEQLLEFQNNP
jgi:hypothetical protein